VEVIDIGLGRLIELDAACDQTRVRLPSSANSKLAAELEKCGFVPDADQKVWVRDLDEHTGYLARRALNAT
jgi:hypothetical protein